MKKVDNILFSNKLNDNIIKNVLLELTNFNTYISLEGLNFENFEFEYNNKELYYLCFRYKNFNTSKKIISIDLISQKEYYKYINNTAGYFNHVFAVAQTQKESYEMIKNFLFDFFQSNKNFSNDNFETHIRNYEINNCHNAN